MVLTRIHRNSRTTAPMVDDDGEAGNGEKRSANPEDAKKRDDDDGKGECHDEGSTRNNLGGPTVMEIQ